MCVALCRVALASTSSRRFVVVCVCVRSCLPVSAVKINDPTAEGGPGVDGDGKASFEFADFDDVDVDDI